MLFLLYRPVTRFLEVYSLRTYLNSYVGGRGDVRDMESAIQSIAQDCAHMLKVPVCVGAWVILQRGDAMALVCDARPL
jgi:hypothetical protein